MARRKATYRRANSPALAAALAPVVTDLGTRLLKGKSDAFVRAGKAERIRLLRKMARSSVPLRLALANDAAAASVSDAIAQFLKAGGDDIALNVAAQRVSNPGWLQTANRAIAKKGTKGAFKKQARRAGYDDTLAFARKVTRAYKRWERDGSPGRRPYTLRTYRRALYALNAQQRQR